MCRITKSPTYLVRNPYSYCFRINVPGDLQPFIERREIRRSLKTGSIKKAKCLARGLASDFQNLFHNIRNLIAMQDLTNAEIKQIVHRYIHDLIDRFEDLRVKSMPIHERPQMLNGLAMYTDIMRLGIPENLNACDHTFASQAFKNTIGQIAPDIDQDSQEWSKPYIHPQ